jgi:hypothetical protein
VRYRIRLMDPADVPVLKELHREQNERDGTNYPLTEVFDPDSHAQKPNIPLALVILSGDEVRQGATFEARTAEMMLVGCDAKATATLHRQIGSAFDILRGRGFVGVHCFVPKQVVDSAQKPLEDVGFKRDDEQLAHFYLDLTEAQEQE